MSSKFAGVTFDDQAATPSDDAIIRRAILADGILTGCEVSYTGSTLTMTAGQLMICGRQVKHPSTQNWAVADATTGFARLVLTIDLTRTSSKDTFEQVVDTVEYASAVDGFADLVQEDINASGTKYQIVAAVVSLTTGGISGIVSQLGQTSAVMGDKSVIIVTAPTGSTVTCTKGTTVKTAREKDGKWTFKNLDLGAWTVTATLDDQTAVKTVTLEQLTVVYLTLAYRSVPEFTYTGDYEIVQDDDTPIEDVSSYSGDWKIRFLTSGTLTFADLGHAENGAENGIDVFLVGGGGGGSAGGGGGGYTKTLNGVSVATGTSYAISIGAGGTSSQDKGTAGKGGTTSAFDYSANGGYGGEGGSGKGKGGNGGSGGGGYGNGRHGKGGTDGGNGVEGGGTSSYAGGKGQGTTTREFAESGARLYSSGGSHPSNNVITTANSGDGGGGFFSDNSSAAMYGASGIVVIRNAR